MGAADHNRMQLVTPGQLRMFCWYPLVVWLSLGIILQVVLVLTSLLLVGG